MPPLRQEQTMKAQFSVCQQTTQHLAADKQVLATGYIVKHRQH